MRKCRFIEILALVVCVTVYGGAHRTLASPDGSTFATSTPFHRRTGYFSRPRGPSAFAPAMSKPFRKGQRLLKPLPSPRPPMSSAVGWLTSEGAPVCVVAVGRACGERWLRALHGGGRAPVLLWWPAAQAREGSAPAWLGGREVYLLATNDTQRLLAFLKKDVASTAYYDQLRESLGYVEKHLQLKSTSRTMVSVVDANSNVRKTLFQIHSALVMRHQIPDWLLIHETGREANGQLSLRGWPASAQPPLTYCAGVACLDAQADTIAPESGDILMATAIPKIMQFTFQHLGIFGLDASLIGPHKRLLMEMTKRMKIKWINMFHILNRLIQKKSTSVDASEYENPNIMPLLVRGLVEVYAAPMATNVTLKQTINAITGSGRMMQVRVAVPGALALPAWSLPLRVWSPGVWLALAGAVWAYALAWRAVAGESLAASAAAALRAFSSCGGAPQDRVRATPQRLQLAAALLASAVVLVSAYQGRLFTLMSRPQRGAEIDTWEKLAASGLPVYTTDRNLLWHFRHPDPEAHSARELRARRRAARLLPSHLVPHARLASALRGRRACLLSWRRDLRLAQRVLRASSQRQMRLRPLPQAFVETQQMLLARRNWPWTDATNQLILRLDAGGVRDFWDRDYWQKLAFMRRMMPGGTEISLALIEENDGDPKPFNLPAVSAHLQLLAAGLVAAALVLAGELLTHRRKRRD